MDKSDFRSLQLSQLDVMDEIHRMCVKAGIKYSLACGSVIGAVRHKGFIPWDYDIDCMMLREDYQHFKSECVNNLRSRFSYYDYTNVDNYDRPHAIVAINGTKIVRKYDKYNRIKFNPGIYVDIFPLDFVSPNESERAVQLAKVNALKKKISIKKCYNYNNSYFCMVAKRARSLSQCRFTLNQLNEQLDVLMKSYTGSEQTYVCSFAAKTDKGDKASFPLAWYGEPVLTEFEDRKFYILLNPHDYLQKAYGNYLELPPREVRDLNLSVFESVEFDQEYV